MGKLKGVIIAVILVALVGGFYFYVSNVGKDDDGVVVSAVQDVSCAISTMIILLRPES